MELMSLPLVMIENILSYLSYDEIAKTRLVSPLMNTICSQMLNRGFSLIERKHSAALKNVKAQLPRRESERRYHQLSRHCDILTSIETRISMLNMTYGKFIDHEMCCFIPGKVIDEILRVLILVETESNPPRAHEVLQELRDISSMAIEHFDDKISPVFRKRLQESASQPTRQASSVLATLTLRQDLTDLNRRSLLNAKMSLHTAAQYKKMFRELISQKRLVYRQCRIMKRMIMKTKEQEATIAELKKRLDECDVKYSELTHANVGGKTLAGTSEVSSSSQSLRNFSSQIKLDLSVLPIGTSKRNANTILPNMKPRQPVIRLPSLSEMEGEPSAKVLKTEPKKLKLRGQGIQKTRTIANKLRKLTDISTFDADIRSLELMRDEAIEKMLE